ncbi:MAG TPA: lytic transglycosylase domain-containing protein [Acidimicrobiia bacterium]
MTAPEPPRFPKTRLKRGWLRALQGEADQRRRRRRLARTIVAFALVDLVVLVGILVLVGVLTQGGSSAPAPVRLPAFVTGAARRALAPVFARAATESHVPVTLVMALTWRESEWEEGLVSPAGAVGIGQLLPVTSTFVARDLLREPNLDPRRATDNIRLTARYLRELIEELGGSERLGVGAYLQGSTSVRAQGLTPQTAAYIQDVDTLRAAFDRARRLA